MRIIITDNQILELLELARQGRAKQANIGQKPETESQDRKDNKSNENQNNQTVKEVDQRFAAEDTEDQAEIAQVQSQNQNQDDITSTDLTLRPCAKGELYDIGPYVGIAGESCVSHESCDAPSPSRFQSTIVEGGVEGDPVTEEPRVGSVGQQKENIVDLSSVFITDTASELREGDSGSDYDDMQDLLGEIDSITRDDAKGTYFPEPGGDEGSYLTDSSWGFTSNTTIWDGLHKNVVTSVVTDSGDLAGLLPTRPGGGPGCGRITVGMLGKFKEETQFFPFTSTEPSDIEEEPSDVPHLAESFLFTLPDPPDSEEEPPDVQLLADSVLLSPMEEAVIGATGVLAQEEPWAPTRAPNDIINIENYNNNYHCSVVPSVNIDADVDEGEVDEDPPTRSKYDQTNKGESITIMEVIAGTDVKKKDDTVIVATEGGTHGKIIGYNSGYYYDCDYWDAYDIRDENMEIESGTRLPSASYLSPCKALLRAGDFVFTGQPPGG